MEEKKLAGIKATEFIKNNMTLGLGTGSTAYYMIREVGRLVQQGLNIRAVATSQSTEKLAKELGIPLVSVDAVDTIDLAIDGVDEIDPSFNAVKGGGGALLREKMVSNLACQVIWIMDASKQVAALGAFPLPVEILPYGYTHILRELESLSFHPALRMDGGAPFVTDNRHYIVDLHLGPGIDIEYVSGQLASVTGVLETGLFLNVCDRIIVGRGSTAEVIENTNKTVKIN